MIPAVDELLTLIQALHTHIRDEVVAACEASDPAVLAAVAGADEPGDTIYAIDRVSEEVLIEFFARTVAPRWPLVLIAEGLAGGQVVLPAGTAADDALIRVIVDPIDGTRGLMYQKRSAWILTGVAPNNGPQTGLRDIVLAVQTEIPLLKQHLCDMLWVAGVGAPQAMRINRLDGAQTPFVLRPSRATDIAHGFATICRFFPGARSELAAIDEAVMRGVLGPPPPGKAQCFEDQYISSGGQLYELMAGHDRFVADLRPLVAAPRLICSHPYDLATLLIAERAGVIVTDLSGAPLDAPLAVDADVGWIGYANQAIRDLVEPVLLAELRRGEWQNNRRSGALL